jgi:hypothetical protein
LTGGDRTSNAVVKRRALYTIGKQLASAVVVRRSDWGSAMRRNAELWSADERATLGKAEQTKSVGPQINADKRRWSKDSIAVKELKSHDDYERGPRMREQHRKSRTTKSFISALICVHLRKNALSMKVARGEGRSKAK